MFDGAVAQLGEHLLCKQGVTGSIPVSSTRPLILRVVLSASPRMLREARYSLDLRKDGEFRAFGKPAGQAMLKRV